jgi:hypothetical protein
MDAAPYQRLQLQGWDALTGSEKVGVSRSPRAGALEQSDRLELGVAAEDVSTLLASTS